MKRIIVGIIAVAFVATGIFIYVDRVWGASAGEPGTRTIRILPRKSSQPSESAHPTVQARANECAEHYSKVNDSPSCDFSDHDVSEHRVFWYELVDGSVPAHVYGGYACTFDDNYPPDSACPPGTTIYRNHGAHYLCEYTGSNEDVPNDQKVCIPGFELVGKTIKYFHCMKTDRIYVEPSRDGAGQAHTNPDASYGSILYYLIKLNTYDTKVCRGRGAKQAKIGRTPRHWTYCCLYTEPMEPPADVRLPQRRLN